MGLDVAFSLVTLIISNALSPLTSVAFSYLSSAHRCSRHRGRSFSIFAGAGAVACDQPHYQPGLIERQKEPIDRLNVIAVHFRNRGHGWRAAPRDGRPAVCSELFALIIILSCALIGLSALVIWRAGLERGVVIRHSLPSIISV
jgi:hypothetical protein